MINFLLSILTCAIPDSLFLTILITKIKSEHNKKKNILLFFLILIGYILFIMIKRFSLLLYFFYIIHIFLCMKILYKSHISDIFIVVFGYICMILTSIVGALFNSINYYMGLVVNKVLLFISLLFMKKYKLIYLKYRKNWNRHSGGKIKSITLRNASLLTLNIMIVILDICIILSSIYFFG
jgi:hypothetical protein